MGMRYLVMPDRDSRIKLIMSIGAPISSKIAPSKALTYGVYPNENSAIDLIWVIVNSFIM